MISHRGARPPGREAADVGGPAGARAEEEWSEAFDGESEASSERTANIHGDREASRHRQHADIAKLRSGVGGCLLALVLAGRTACQIGTLLITLLAHT